MTTDAEIVELVTQIRSAHRVQRRNPYLPEGWQPFAPGPVCDPIVLAAYVKVWEQRAASAVGQAA